MLGFPKLRKITAGLTFSVAALAAVAHVPQALAETKLVYAGYITRSAVATTLDEWFMDQVEQRSNGRITFERYYSGALMKARDLFPGLTNGAVDIATGAPMAYNPQSYPLSNIMMPYITDKADAATKAIIELYGSNEEIKQEYERQGIKMLWSLAFPDGAIWSNRPIHEPEDLQGVRIRAVSGIGWAMEKLGASPVPMSFTEAVEALNRGAVDAVTNAPFDSGVNVGLPKVAKYATDAGRLGINGISVTGINKARFEGLPEEDQAVILQVAAEVPGQFAKVVNAAIEKAARRMVEQGGDIQVSVSTDAQAAKWKAAVADTLRGRYIESVSRVTKNGGAIYDQFVALVRKHEPDSTYTPGLEAYLKAAGKQ
ncbi:TRAP-type C4-dicarboxylate transport system, substrate-binding protein [Tistlia consotensis]|uniref:TRAP-type C4-dicarboxylate transport system, substrate-binding protein n=1 Tax=Tistlia consotensis USBA 355 TaxID=560819 RepID=A0A1Y6BZ19_9PROT|nr:TRAP transporter substrate-binding protein DctP [Tistlia consotensis]SMF36830.1 TRAP-type C4-dicarboxylate transport system, substrate-binding protein [Tistlia consotensis USBA 355]SNR72169.1 TRAP-type C4-dicarboxylate transport system, substrate-binding protein [Tistlia consotensis]